MVATCMRMLQSDHDAVQIPHRIEREHGAPFKAVVVSCDSVVFNVCVWAYKEGRLIKHGNSLEIVNVVHLLVNTIKQKSLLYGSWFIV